MRLLLVLAALAGALLAAPSELSAQARGVRFEITQAGDSTFTFAVAENGWVRPGLRGIAVDPRRRDVLIARFRVLRVRGGSATALITGQTGAVTPEYVAIVDEPQKPFLARGSFWGGVVLGALLGVVAGSAL